VESALGHGTRFELFFPATDPALPVQPAAKALDTPEESDSATILVANDEPALRQAVVPILRANGYCVLEAQTADHALEIAQQTRGYLDVLLTNIGVPGMRGTELASRVVAVHPEVQVIYMSGYAGGGARVGVAGEFRVFSEAFRLATLLEQLKFVRRRR